MSKTAVNFLMYNSLKRKFKSHKSLLPRKTGKLFTVDNPFSLYYMHKFTMNKFKL